MILCIYGYKGNREVCIIFNLVAVFHITNRFNKDVYLVAMKLINIVQVKHFLFSNR